MNAPETLARTHLVFLKTTNPLHISDAPGSPQDDNVTASFADVLKSAINKVNDLQVESEDLSQKMIYEPESVDIHTVMIAAQKAELALTFTKAVRDEAIRAYRELMNLR
jgi:flagellar hook-basal body complex protein FliE